MGFLFMHFGRNIQNKKLWERTGFDRGVNGIGLQAEQV